MVGISTLPTEVRLMIFKDVFEKADINAIAHPLLHVSRDIRSEYITIFSGKISLHVSAWLQPGRKKQPNLTITRDCDGEAVLTRRCTGRSDGFGSGSKFGDYCDDSEMILRPHSIETVSLVSTNNCYAGCHSRWGYMVDEPFKAFADSPFAWWIQHLSSIRLAPCLSHHSALKEVTICYKVKLKPELTVTAFAKVKERTLPFAYGYAYTDPQAIAVVKSAENRLAAWLEKTPCTFTHAWILELMREACMTDYVHQIDGIPQIGDA